MEKTPQGFRRNHEGEAIRKTVSEVLMRAEVVDVEVDARY